MQKKLELNLKCKEFHYISSDEVIAIRIQLKLKMNYSEIWSERTRLLRNRVGYTEQKWSVPVCSLYPSLIVYFSWTSKALKLTGGPLEHVFTILYFL